MKKLILIAAALAVATPAMADYRGNGGSSSTAYASRGGVVNSATVTQSAGAFAFNQIAQGERATIESPRYDPLIEIERGAFVMPYFSESFNASRGGDVRVYDPIGNVD